MIIQIVSTLLLIPLMSLINRTRGGGGLSTVVWLPLAGQACRTRATILFGLLVSGYAALNHIIAPHAIKHMMVGDFDFSLLIISALGFLDWATLPWSEYMDMGTWQREHPQAPAVKPIDGFINLLAKWFPNTFIRRDQWDASVWNTKHAYSDLVGMILRTGVMSVPLFVYYAYYFANWHIVLISLIMFAEGFVYFIWSKILPNTDYIGRAEWTGGAINWGGSLVALFLMVQ